MKFILSHLLFLVAISLLIFGCSNSPDPIDSGPNDQAKYYQDDFFCRSQAKEIHPHTPGKLSHGAINSEGISMVLMEYNHCMEEKGWKSH